MDQSVKVAVIQAASIFMDKDATIEKALTLIQQASEQGAKIVGYSDLKSSTEVMCTGGSAIVGPMGDYVAKPVWGKEEIIIADLDMKQIVYSQFDFDSIGHYARPDVFKLEVNSKKQESIEWK